LPSLSAISAKLAELERIVANRARTEDDVLYLNDPEEGLDHLRIEDDGSTIEIGDGKPQPENTVEEIERLTQLRKQRLR
jgi:hypothetical protein